MSSKSTQSLLLVLALAPMMAMGQPAFPSLPKRSRNLLPTNAATAAPLNAPAAPAPVAVPTAPDAMGATPGTGATPGVTTTGEKEAAIYTYNLVGTPMEQILEDPSIGWSALVGRTLLRATASDAALKGTITLKTKTPLTKTEAIMAIETVLGMNGITIVPIGDKFAKVVLEATAGQSGGALSTNSVPEMGRFITQIVQYKYVSAQDITEVLKQFTKGANTIMAIPSTQTLVLRDYAENVKRMMEMIERIDVPSTLEVKPEIVPIKYALAADIQQVLTSLGGGGGGVSVGRSMGGGGLGGNGSYRSSASMGSTGGNTGSSMNSGASSLNGAGGASSAGGGGARNAFQSNLQKLVSKAAGGAGAGDFQVLGQSKIIADERTNSLLVFANKEDMDMIKLIIAKLDVVLAQVLIEAIIMEVNVGDGRDIGISYLQKAKNVGSANYPINTIGGLNNGNGALANSLGTAATNGASSFPSGFSYWAGLNNDLDIVATAIAQDSRVNVLSRPSIQTSHAVPASLFVGQTVPYVTGTYYAGSYNGGNSSQYTEKEVGISLEVLPLINPDGLVVMDIRSDIEDLGASVTIDGNAVPTTVKRNADAKVAVRDRDTIMLGGFMSNSKSKSHSGIPVLMDIPFLGALFRSNSDKNSKVELIVLIRPTVLPTPQAAAIFATERRNTMSGVKQAEIDIREDERKSNEAIEKQLKKNADAKAKKAKSDAKKGVKATESNPIWQDPATTPAVPAAPAAPAAPTAPATSPTDAGTHIPE